jgi:hypothetical protein
MKRVGRWILRVLDWLTGAPWEEVSAPPRVVPDMADAIVRLDPSESPFAVLLRQLRKDCRARDLMIRAPGVASCRPKFNPNWVKTL